MTFDNYDLGQNKKSYGSVSLRMFTKLPTFVFQIFKKNIFSKIYEKKSNSKNSEMSKTLQHSKQIENQGQVSNSLN